MTRNEILIEKYKLRIKKMEREQGKTNYSNRIICLDGKISVYKIVIVDLQE